MDELTMVQRITAIETKMDRVQSDISSQMKTQIEGFAKLEKKLDEFVKYGDATYAKKKSVDDKFKDLHDALEQHTNDTKIWVRFLMQWAPAIVTMIIGLLIYFRGG